MISLWGTLVLLAFVSGSNAIGQASCVSFTQSSSGFSVFSNGAVAPVFLSPDEWPGVQRAASDFATDIQSVTGIAPKLSNDTSSVQSSTAPIIIGTLGKSSLIDQIVNNTKLDVSAIEGQWEAFLSQVVDNPLLGVEKAYVIVGADKRGTIFALYDLSEQFGVSPWYWWADVPSTQRSAIYLSSTGCSHGSPTVKYRGVFLNDEQPALQNWAMEKFTNGTGAALTGSPFNHYFYTKLFELILRMKGNYLWPAMWSSAFGIDDPENQFLADYYGVVMATSHEEPMMRSTPVEWDLFGSGPWDYSVNAQNIYNFWVVGAERSRTYESVYSIGMRGDGDLPLAASSDSAAITLLEQVISDQRGILTNVFNVSDVTTIPQVWCLYKEVEGYYDEGMTAPDDVTLLWTDDNYGNIRRYPIYSERNRTGGAGVYYHYDYVGDPRNYKWITTTQISKVYEQMSLAVDRDATRIWILNVGDLKPYEMSTEFFVAYAWDASLWNLDNIDSFVSLWAQREFGLSAQDSNVVADIIANLTMINARRKPELLNSTTYSVSNYREAENVLALWNSLNESSTAIYNSLSADKQPAFFELVLHPVQASATVSSMWIAAGINNMRGEQAFLSTNNYADQVETLFEQDYDLELEYHTIVNGKWDHMMDQTHTYYVYWQEPSQNAMPPITRVQSRKASIAGVMRIAPEGTLAAWPGDNQYQCAAGYSCGNPALTIDSYVPYQSRYVDVGAGGPIPFTYTVSTNVTWLTISPSSGSISPSNPEERVYLTVPDWSQVDGAEIAAIWFNATATGQPLLSVPATITANHTVAPAGFAGFVEGDGVISIEAAHASRNTSVDGITWTNIPQYGRTLSGITPWPRMANNGSNFTAGTGPSIEYDFYNFNTVGGNGSVAVTTYVSPSLNANGLDRPIAVAIQVDSQTPQTSYFIPSATPGDEPAAWDGMDGFAANNIVPIAMNFTAAPGAHTLSIWMVEPAVVVQKIVIDTGGLLPSYLGPPESVVVG